MDQQQPKDDRREIARQLFKALCARFPDKYVVLIESRGAAGQPPQLAIPSVENSATTSGA